MDHSTAIPADRATSGAGSIQSRPRGLNVRQLAHHIIRPVLTYAADGLPGFVSEAAVELLLGTIAQESGFCHLAQIGGGPAQGIFQIEPATRADVHENYLRYRPDLERRVLSLLAPWPAPPVQLATNIAYATAIARLVYYRSPVRLASAGDVAGHARTWKAVYNTAYGKGTEAEFIDNFETLVEPYL